MKGVLLLVIALLSSLYADEALTAAKLQELTFDQKLGAAVSLDLPFRNEKNETVTLGDCLQSRPAILILGYYECPMLCNLVLNGVVESLQEIRPAADPGEEVIVVTIDPRETPALAASKKQTYLKRLGRPEARDRWHFLCGGEREVRTLANEVGFHYQFDRTHNQFAHPSGIVILTPKARVSRYFLGVSYPAGELRQALADAALDRTGSVVQSLALLCSRFLPLTGKFSGTVMLAVRVVAIGTLLMLIGIAVVYGRTTRGRSAAP